MTKKTFSTSHLVKEAHKLTTRQYAILTQLLKNKHYTSVRMIAGALSVSEKTVRNDLQIIEQLLTTFPSTFIEKKAGAGILLHASETTKKTLQSMLNVDNTPNMTKEETMYAVLSQLLLYPTPVTMQSLAKTYYTNQSAIRQILQQVDKYVRPYHLSVERKQHIGIRMMGDEQNIRACLLTILLEQPDIRAQLLPLTLLEEQKIERTIQSVKQLMDIRLTDEAIQTLLLIVSISITRMKHQKIVIQSDNLIKRLQNTHEFLFSNKLADDIEHLFQIKLPLEERTYMSSHLLGAQRNQATDIVDNAVVLLAKSMIDLVESNIDISFAEDTELLPGLVTHLQPAIHRLQTGIQLKNPLLGEIKQMYNSMFLLLSKTIKHLDKINFTEDEIGYITLHFQSALLRRKKETMTKKSIILVCSSGTGTSQLLQASLKDAFPFLHVLQMISKTNLHDALKIHSPDSIISTVQVSHPHIPCMVVPPLLSNVDKEKLAIFFQTLDGLSQLSFQDKRYTKHQLHRNLTEVLLQLNGRNYHIERNYQPMLDELIRQDTVNIVDQVASWEDAIALSAQPLLQNGSITEKYIEAMVANIKKNGPYIIISPEIAIPHASPEFGVNKIGMSVLKVKQSVSLFNEAKNKVTVFIAIAAIDDQLHLKALSQLTKILLDEKKRNQLLLAETKKEITDIFQIHTI